MKVKAKNAKILVMGTPKQAEKWISRFGSQVQGVEFIYINKPEHLKSRHKKNCRVLILSDPKKLMEKVGDKIKRLNPIVKPEEFEAQILGSQKQDDLRFNAISWYRENAMGEKVEVVDE